MPRRAHCHAASDPASPAPTMRTISVIPAPCDPLQGLPLQVYGFPLIQKRSAQFFIELDRRSLPVQHLPPYAKATPLSGDTCYAGEQRFSNAFAAELVANVDVFKKESSPALKG